MSLPFQGMPRSDSIPLVGSEAGGSHQLMERLRRLRLRLPNLRVCQVVGAKVCLRACDPFQLDSTGAAELMQLGLRSIVDLRSEHQRTEALDAPLYRHLRVLRWNPDPAGDCFVDESSLTDAADDPVAVVYRVDCLRSPQAQLRRFLSRCAGGRTGPAVPDVSAYLLPASAGRPAARQFRDLLDCFPDALAAAFRVLARPDAYPTLLVSQDGQQAAAVVVCLMQMVLGEDPSILADIHAASEVEFLQSQGLAAPDTDPGARLRKSRRTMLELVGYILETYRSAENYLLKAGVSLMEIRQLKTV